MLVGVAIHRFNITHIISISGGPCRWTLSKPHTKPKLNCEIWHEKPFILLVLWKHLQGIIDDMTFGCSLCCWNHNILMIWVAGTQFWMGTMLVHTLRMNKKFQVYISITIYWWLKRYKYTWQVSWLYARDTKDSVLIKIFDQYPHASGFSQRVILVNHASS